MLNGPSDRVRWGLEERILLAPTPRKGLQSDLLSGAEGSDPIDREGDLRLQAAENARLVLQEAATQGLSREELARLMSVELGRPTSLARLNKIASRDPRGQLTVPEAMALCRITKSIQPVQGALDELGLVAVPRDVARAGQLALDLGKILREFGAVA